MTEQASAPNEADAEASAPPIENGDPRRSRVREVGGIVLAALIVALLLKAFVVQAFWIPSGSMLPTLERGDRVLVCRICLRFDDVDRGDVVVFGQPHPEPGSQPGGLEGWLRSLGAGLGVPGLTDDFVKRVIGLPGDVIEIRGGELFRNGRPVDEPYLASPPDSSSFGPITVPDGMLFVLGDNRAHSSDSRFPPPLGLGYVPEDVVIGRVFLRVWPPSRIGGIG